MTLHTPISPSDYTTHVVRRGESVVLISCPAESGAQHLEITFTQDEAENIGVELIEAARGRERGRYG